MTSSISATRAIWATVLSLTLGLLVCTATAKTIRFPVPKINFEAPSGQGYKLRVLWNSDLYDNVLGGRKQGYATDSVVTISGVVSSSALGLWRGGHLAIGLQAISSTQPSRYVGDLQGVSNLAATNQRQVSQFWFSQKFNSGVIRTGIIDVNNFFDVSQAASLFTNASSGISPTLTADAPTPTYPNASWGLMGRVGSKSEWSEVAVFEGNPLQRSEVFGHGFYLIAEHDRVYAATETRISLGGWYRKSPLPDSPPLSDWGLYGNFQTKFAWIPKATFYTEIGISPDNVNQVPFYLATGITWNPDTSWVSNVGIGMARAWIRHALAETSIETTALFPVGNSVTVQPDIQCVLHPSGKYPRALMVGIRLNVAL